MRILACLSALVCLVGPSVAQEPTELGDRTKVVVADREPETRSAIDLDQLTPTQVENLVVLGKVWGFLKYHHPRVAAGELPWDHELFRVLRAVVAASDPRARNEALLEWTGRIGVPAACDPCAQPIGDAQLRPALDWIHDESLLGRDLSAYLEMVHRNRIRGRKQYYVSSVASGFAAVDAMYGNEDAHASALPADLNYRILTLLRFWNIIEYWFPYRDVIDESWDTVLRESLSRFVAAKDADAFRLATLALVARVDDTHAWVRDGLGDARPPRGPCLLPFALRFVEGRLVVARYVHVSAGPASGLRAGDVVTAIDGVSVNERVQEWSPYYSASNEPTLRRDIARFVTRGKCTDAAIAVDRDGEAHTLQVARLPEARLDRRDLYTHDRPGDTFQKLSDEVSYLKLSSISTADVARHIESARGSRGLVIDVRNYPAESVAFELAASLIDQPTPFARFTWPDFDNPGAFLWAEPVKLVPRAPRFEGKVAILVDEVSISAAEFTAMALRASPRAIIVGSTTAGTDGDVRRIPLPAGLQTMISGVGVFYPDRKPTQRVGIALDIVVEPTIAGIRDGRDEVLERAVRELLGPSADASAIRRMTAVP